jgi:uncharacterized protein (TIGR04551 family)
MRRTLALTCLLTLAAAQSGPLLAQQAPPQPPGEPAAPESPEATPAAPGPETAPAADPEAPAAEGEEAPAEGEVEGETAPEASPGLEPPELAPIELPAPPALAEEPPLSLPDPTEAAAQLDAAEPEQQTGWTAPENVFRLHGYLRMRGTLLRNGYLGHGAGQGRLFADGRTNYDPFLAFRPNDKANVIDNVVDPGAAVPTASDVAPVDGGCGEKGGTGAGTCDKRNQVSGDLRLRLKPEIHLSDDIRVKAWIDVLDNVGAGTLGYGPNAPDAGNTIRVRRAWGEARNRDLGELRFGRMGADWGLGILDNGGDRYGIDSDFSSDVDRLMAITSLGGFYFMAAYDWASEGDVQPGLGTPSGVPIDRTQNDDLDVFTFAIARKLEQEAQESRLLRGEAVLNFGAYFVYRDQLLGTYQPTAPNASGSATGAETPAIYSRVNQTQYVPDLWLQLLWQGLRLELEATYTAGTLEGGCPLLDTGRRESVNEAVEKRSREERGESGSCKLRQLGIAFETEYRLFDDRLGLYFFSGFASGDSKSYGLSSTNDPSLQRGDGSADSSTLSTQQFHPDYRVDLILWRTLMGRVAGGYYFKPGVSYDFIKDPYGQLAGGRLDVIYSRASSPKQTWGGSGNLGLEIDLSLYYRSEDGPDLKDGFYGLVQGGVLFPFAGLDYADPDGDTGAITGSSAKTALIMRGVVGIAY